MSNALHEASARLTKAAASMRLMAQTLRRAPKDKDGSVHLSNARIDCMIEIADAAAQIFDEMGIAVEQDAEREVAP